MCRVPLEFHRDDVGAGQVAGVRGRCRKARSRRVAGPGRARERRDRATPSAAVEHCQATALAVLPVSVIDGRLRPVEFLARDATSSDYDAFLGLVAELRAPDPVPTPEQFAAHVAPHSFFFVEGGKTCAYGFVKPYGDTAHVVHVVVAPDRRRLGLGRAVMQQAAVRARAAGCTSWYLNVKKDNTAAISLYELCGLRTSFESVLFTLAWTDLARLPAGSAAAASEVEPASDCVVEEAFALPRGLLASSRGTSGRLLRTIFDGARPVAFAAFDPDLSIAASFRVENPRYARPLLESIRSHVSPGQSFIRVFAEGDAALASVLRAAGGKEELRTLRMKGAIGGTR